MTTRRVLIVDDSRVSRIMIRTVMVARHPDWEYVEAANIDEAVAKVAEGHIDLVSLDYNMPGLTGLDGVELLRAQQPGIRIVLLTANIQQATRDRAAAMGVSFVDKPVSEASIGRVLGALEA